MTFEEFESHARKVISVFSTIRKLTRDEYNAKDHTSKSACCQQIDQLQEEAAVAIGAIDHIIDRFGKRTCVFGEGNHEVDMFRESLSITGICGAGILDNAAAELRLLLTRLRGRTMNLSVHEVSRLLSGDSMPHRSDAEGQPTGSDKQIDVFISYSSADREIAEDLANRLRALQLVVFMGHDTITTGPAWRTQVGVALRRCTIAVLLLSAQSLQSDWVRYEIGAIWALNKPVAPALLDCELTQLPELVRDFQARSVASPTDRAVFCHEVERLVRVT